MIAERRDIAVVGEPLRHASEAGLVEVWRARCGADAAGHYVSRDPRLFVVMDALAAEIRLDAGGDVGRAASRTASASYVPAGLALSMSVAGPTEVRHLDVHFDPERLGPIEGLDAASADAPRLMFEDARVQRFARLLAEACRGANGGLGLYGDGLAAALVAAAFAPARMESRRSALSDRQLRTVIDHIEERCGQTIRLADLARLADVSESYLSHAFKAATGMPPHRWQLQARVRRAKAMMARRDASLSEVSGALGFSDQAHFTRVFRRLAGCTPSNWRERG